MYVFSFIDLFYGVWGIECNVYGLIVLVVVCCYLFVWVCQLYQDGFIECCLVFIVGMVFLLLGLLCFVLGCLQIVFFMEVGLLILILIGIVLLQFGICICCCLWFVFFFMLFMVLLLVLVVDLFIQLFKIGVFYVFELILCQFGYLIVCSGVIFYIGFYQLLVVDVCVGLNLLFILEVFGLLYMNLVCYQLLFCNLVLVVLIVLIFFMVNMVCVMVLVLIIYYFGDVVGQGFLYGFVGMLLFFVVLGLIIVLDSFLCWIVVCYVVWCGLLVFEVVLCQCVVVVVQDIMQFFMNLWFFIVVVIVMVVLVGLVQLLVLCEVNVVKKGNFVIVIFIQFGQWKEVLLLFL